MLRLPHPRSPKPPTHPPSPTLPCSCSGTGSDDFTPRSGTDTYAMTAEASAAVEGNRCVFVVCECVL